MAVQLGYGTTISWNAQTVAKLKNIGGVELSVDMVDVTTHQSADTFKEFLPGLIDSGEIPIEGLFDATDSNGQVAMVTDSYARTARAVVITFPAATGATWTISSAYITKIKIGDAPVDGMIPFTASIKPVVKPLFAVATSTGLTTPFFTMSQSAVISPAASGSVYDYVATVLTAVTSLTITPTATAGAITVNGSTVATGVASSAIALGSAGSITTVTVVVTETNKAPRTYTIRVVRP